MGNKKYYGLRSKIVFSNEAIKAKFHQDVSWTARRRSCVPYQNNLALGEHGLDRLPAVIRDKQLRGVQSYLIFDFLTSMATILPHPVFSAE